MTRRARRRALAEGRLARRSDCHGGRGRGCSTELLPMVPGTPTGRPHAGTIDGRALADELDRLATLARRGWSS